MKVEVGALVTRDWAELYGVVFGVLGRLHREPPTQDFLDALGELVAEWPLAADGGSAGLREWQASADAAESIESIATDHDRLYGVSAVALVSPFESVQTEEEGLVFGRATLEVRAGYELLGLRAPVFNREPDDHIGLEFDFVSQALSAAAAAVADASAGVGACQDQITPVVRRFVAEHLAGWAPPFFAEVADAAGTHFMKGLALLSGEVLAALDADLGVEAIG